MMLRQRMTVLTLSCLGGVAFSLLLLSVAGGVACGCALFFVLNSLDRIVQSSARERYDPEAGIVRGYHRRKPARGTRRRRLG